MLIDPNQRATTVKKPGHYRNHCRLLNKQREQHENNQKKPGNKNGDVNNNNNHNEKSNRAEGKPKNRKLFIHQVKLVGRQTTPQKTGKTESGPRKSQSK